MNYNSKCECVSNNIWITKQLMQFFNLCAKHKKCNIIGSHVRICRIQLQKTHD